jgi:hypothetical protein
MNWINSWNAYAKQWDKINIEIRFFGLTLFNFQTDLSKKKIRFIILNFGIENEKI